MSIKSFPIKDVEYKVYGAVEEKPIDIARKIIDEHLEDPESGRIVWSYFRSPCIYPPFRRTIRDAVTKIYDDKFHVSRTFHPYSRIFEDGPHVIVHQSIDDYCARMPANHIYLQLCGGHNDNFPGVPAVGIKETRSGSEIGRYEMGFPPEMFPAVAALEVF